MGTRKAGILAVIPARGGSKGIPRKNLQLLDGKPLLVWSIEAALSSGVLGQVHVSTDAEEIARIAENCGASVIQRPAELSGDSAATEEALIHAVGEVSRVTGTQPEHVLTLQPTSPLRKPGTIAGFVSAYLEASDRIDAMLSLSECHGDYWRRDDAGVALPA